jgi:hypothetical protein
MITDGSNKKSNVSGSFLSNISFILMWKLISAYYFHFVTQLLKNSLLCNSTGNRQENRVERQGMKINGRLKIKKEAKRNTIK